MSKRGCGVFVTGTDTGVGKTEIACALIRSALRQGLTVTGMKPVAAGARRVDRMLRNADVEALRREGTVRVARNLLNPYVFQAPIAPHLAASDAGVGIDINVIVQAYRVLAARAQIVIVEGAGGFRVPLSDRFDGGDLARRLRLPVILVVGMRLGCLSHALLSVEAITRRDLELAGWVANRIDPAMRRYRDNVHALSERISAPLLAEIPFLKRAPERRAAIDRILRLDWNTLSRH